MEKHRIVINEIKLIAKKLLAMPLVYETIDNIQYYIYYEKECPHHEAHVHVIDGSSEEVFSLVDGRALRGKIKHENDVLRFLSNTSNRRRLLRRHNNWQKKGKCSYLKNPIEE